MFHTLLIANRGEIACRIIKTAKAMGFSTVAVYSSADKNSQHVKLADVAYPIGEASAKSSYLNIEAIIQAALETGAQAIHPGYGFLSENVDFAKACEAAHITFIGPGLEALKAMGSKQLAKQLLEGTSVPLTPGYHGSDQSDETLLNEAKRIGFPILVKAAAGGGGKGMRTVYTEANFLRDAAAARREAMASFADDTLIIEKLMINPRHIEVQIMADAHGHVVHLFERDCSLQRRHQKIIEEAPAQCLTEELRQKITQAACDVARAIHYLGAGTVEFLLDASGQFYFMEMNTRLQVEHPVTEMITGLDLVAWQIKIAAQEPLPLLQDAIKRQGHAIECRIYAEDPNQEFMPSTGRIHFLKEPYGPHIRVDTGIIEGDEITRYYDPMIAKLIVWGETRLEALHRMQSALTDYAIGGVKSNLPFLRTMCQNQTVVQGQITTDFLHKHPIILTQPEPKLALLFAAAYDYLAAQHSVDPLYSHTFSWQMHLKAAWYKMYRIEKTIYSVQFKPQTAQTVILDILEDTVELSAFWQNEQLVIVQNGLPKQRAWFAAKPEGYDCYLPEGVVKIYPDIWAHHQAATAQANHLIAPMPATVVAILKQVGDTIQKGEGIIVLEAMKMEHTIYAPRSGKLQALFCEVGGQVSEGTELLHLTD